jgi:6-phosphogluconate dehydrogenase
MKIGFIGLGRMGENMALNLIEHRHKIVGYNRSPEPTKKLAKKGLIPSYSIKEMLKNLPKQKIIWLMVPAGPSVNQTISKLSPHLRRGDILIDGGNSFFKDSQKRYKKLKKKGIHFLDVGTSGGISGARHGASMMIGGDKNIFKKVEALFRDMCVKDGYGYMGESGAGHFVKMVHNGIEYGMMGAIAEGSQVIKNSPFKTDMKTAIKVYAHGSIIESKLMSWLEKSFNTKGYLNNISGIVPKGETEEEMKKLSKMANMPVLKTAISQRQMSRKKPSYAGKLTAAMRNQFGGHKFKNK